MIICHCFKVTDTQIKNCLKSNLDPIKETKAGTGCRSCNFAIKKVINEYKMEQSICLPDFLKNNKKLQLGQKLYIPIPSQNIVVESSIVELSDVYYDPNSKNSIWHTYDIWGNDNAKSIDFTNAKLVNQIPWTDECVGGHAAYVGDDSFLTLNDALTHIKPSNKKHLRRRLKASRKWIGSDLKKLKPCFRSLDKRIFIRK